MSRKSASLEAQAKPRHNRRDADLEGEDPRVASTLARGLRILRAFRASDDAPLGNRALAERTGLPKPTVSRLTYTLVRLGFLSQDPRTSGFSLAAGVLEPAYTFLSRLDIRQIARPFMQAIASQPGVTVSLATRHELRMTTIESVVVDSPVPLAGLFGGRAPIARTAIGHAYLAGLEETAREALMAELETHYRAEWSTIERRIRRDIVGVERDGYCVVNREWSDKISGVASPVIVAAGGLVLSMSAGGPAQLLSPDLLRELGGRLSQARSEIERVVGRPAG